MKLFDIYTWIAGSKTDFLNQFRNNNNLYAQAQAFWADLESWSFSFVLIFVVFSVASVCGYYKWYNDRAGRHYHPKHWFYFLIGVTFITILATFLIEYIAIVSKLKGALWLQIKIALCNSIYACISYFILSVVWCNALPTNAYRLFKIGKK